MGEIPKVCSPIALQCLYSVRIGRPDILWSVNKLSRAVTKWTRACDRRLVRFDFIHSQHEKLQAILSCGKTLPNSADWDSFQDPDFAGDFEDARSTSEGFFVHLRKSNDCVTKPKGRTKTTLPTSEEDCLREIDHVAPIAKLSRHNALLHICDETEAVIKMVIKGWSPPMRHVPKPQGGNG